MSVDWVGTVWGWIEEHPASAIELIFAGVLAWAAVASMRLSSRLAGAELDPAITVTLELDPDRLWIIHFVVRNAGRGSARNVRLSTEADHSISPGHPDDKLTRMAIFRTGLPFMGPQQELRSAIGTYMSLSKEPIVVHAVYEPDDGRRWRRRTLRSSFVLDVSQFEGVSSIGDTPNSVAADSLEKIAKHVGHIAQGNSQGTLRVLVERRYFLSHSVNAFVHRWFGGQYLNRDYTPWKHFRAEVRRSIAQWWRARRKQRQPRQ